MRKSLLLLLIPSQVRKGESRKKGALFLSFPFCRPALLQVVVVADGEEEGKGRSAVGMAVGRSFWSGGRNGGGVVIAALPPQEGGGGLHVDGYGGKQGRSRRVTAGKTWKSASPPPHLSEVSPSAGGSSGGDRRRTTRKGGGGARRKVSLSSLDNSSLGKKGGGEGGFPGTPSPSLLRRDCYSWGRFGSSQWL